MLDMSNSPPPSPRTKPKYNVPVPKQGQHKPPPTNPTITPVAVNALCEQMHQLREEQSIQNKFLLKLQQQRQQTAVEPTTQQTKFISQPPTDNLYDSRSTDTGF